MQKQEEAIDGQWDRVWEGENERGRELEMTLLNLIEVQQSSLDLKEVYFFSLLSSIRFITFLF